MSINKKLFALALLGVLSVSFLSAAAQDAALHVIRFPERRDVEFQMLPSDRIPNASMKAKVKFEEGQSRIEVSYDKMKPAVLFAGDVTCYVLWAINRDGGAENLGELWARPEKDSDQLKFSTGLRSFALMVTAEPYYQVSRPSRLVIFQNDGRPKPPVQTDLITFSSFAEAPKHGLETLANVRYDGDDPLDLLQAQKAYEIAGRLGAEKYAPEIYREASIGLQQATRTARTRAQRGAQDYARRSVASSNEAIKITLRSLAAEELERRIAERQAQMASLERTAAEAEARAQEAQAQARAAEARSQETERQKAAVERAVAEANQELRRIESERSSLQSALAGLRQEQQALRESMASLREEKARLEAEKEALRQDKEVVEDRLQSALSQVAETRDSARGIILSLADILFDVNKATLKPEAKVALAKLAGILLILPDLNLRIEGHTDSSGSASYNLQLSEQRSRSVFDFLAEQGVLSRRMASVGYGEDRPIADNDTAAGRGKNRRVEIIIAEGTVAEESR